MKTAIPPIEQSLNVSDIGRALRGVLALMRAKAPCDVENVWTEIIEPSEILVECAIRNVEEIEKSMRIS